MEKIPLSRLETVSLLEKIEYTSDFNAHSLLKYGKRADRYRFKNTNVSAPRDNGCCLLISFIPIGLKFS